MDLTELAGEMRRIAQLPSAPSAYYVNADDYAALKAATAPNVPAWVIEEMRKFERKGIAMPSPVSLDGIQLIPSKHVPRGMLVPVRR